ncbi:MAG: S8 family peptidase, partial [Chitinophagales bacterium]
MKQTLLILFLIQTTILSALEDRIDKQVLIQVAPANSHLDYLQNLFPKALVKRTAETFHLWNVEFPTPPPMDYISQLKREGKINLYMRNRRLEPRATTPNDTFFSQQTFHLNNFNPGQSVPYGINSIGAWDYNKSGVTAKGDTIVVAVLDFGFDPNHEDLDYFINHNEIPNDGIDNDENDAIDDHKGWNAGLNNGDLNGTENQHGMTACGGIAAKGNNKIGVSGVAWNCKLIPINNIASIDLSIKAYEYCLITKRLYKLTNKKKGAYIVAVNYSLGTEGMLPEERPIWCIIIDAFGKEGILMTTAVANNPQAVEDYKDMPILCNSPFQINVTTYNLTSLGLDNSGYSKDYVHLAAPHGYWSTLMNNKYGPYKSGASFAAPIVAGTIALMYSNFETKLLDSLHRDPIFVTQKIKEAILKNVDITSGLTNKVKSNGKLNLYKTINYSRLMHDSIYKKKDTTTPNAIISNSSIDIQVYHAEKYIYTKKTKPLPLYVSLYNMLGQLVMERRVENLDEKIDIHHLNHGFYILNYFHDNQIYT